MNSEVTLEQLRGLMQAAESAVEVSNKTGDEFVAVYELRQFDRFSGKYVRQLLTTPVPGDSVASAVGDLLAVMHGDGGHYHAEHGTEKAAADALVKYNAIQQSIAERTPPASGEVVGVLREFLEELAGYRGNMVNGNRLSDRARELLSAAPKQAMGWDADEGASPIGKSVLLCVEDAASGRRRVIRAMRAGLNTMELGCDQEWWEGCTTDEDEQEFCPAGWYERNEYDEVNWHVDDKFVAWMELPSPPEKAPASPAGGVQS